MRKVLPILFVCLFFSSLSYSQAPGDSCDLAIAIFVRTTCDTSNDIEIDFSTAVPVEYTSCDAANTNDGRWFSFIAPAIGNINIVTTSSASSEMAIFDACEGSEIYCSNSTSTADGFVTGLIPSNAYCLLVWEDSNTPVTSFCIREGPVCLPLSGLTASNLTTTSTDLSWNGNASSTGFVIEYGPVGFTLGTGTQVNTGTVGGPVTISGLTDNTNYDAYVWEICMGTETDTLGPTSFTTSCTVQSPIYCQGFELFAVGQLNAIPIDCWVNTNTAAPEWRAEDTGTSSALTGPTEPNTGSRYLYLETSGGALGDTDTLYGPDVNVSSLTIPQLSFYYHMWGGTMGVLYWEISDDGGASWTQLGSLVGQQQPNQTDPWLEHTEDLSAFGNTIQIRFVGERGSSYDSDMAIDDVCIREEPSCLQPSMLTVTNIDSSGADVSWTETDSATDWVVSVVDAGMAPVSGTDTPVSGSPMTTIAGLMQNTLYDVYVRAVCDVGDSSLWTGPVSITTTCAVQIAEYCQSFEAFTSNFHFDGTTFDCWSNVNSSDPEWRIELDGTLSSETGPNGPKTGDRYVYLETSLGSEFDRDTLYGPDVDVSGFSNAELSFFYHMHGATMGVLYWEVSDDGGASWTSLDSFVGQQQINQGDPWLERIDDLSAFGSTLRIRFIGERGSGFTGDMALDDICIRERPSCPQTSMLSISNISDSGADVCWTENGSATDWEVEVVELGMAQGTGSSTAVSGSPMTTLTGLMQTTLYDVYVRAICGVGDSSFWEGPVSFTTNCVAQIAEYCQGFELFPLGEMNSALIDCWKNANTFNPEWVAEDFGTTTGSTGPSGPYSGDRYLHLEAGTSATEGESDTLTGPVVDVSSLTTPEFSFFYHMYGHTMGTLRFELSDDGGSSWNLLDSIAGQQQTATTDPWIEWFGDISAFGDMIMIRFIGIRGSGIFSDMAIDDVCIREKITCRPPEGPEVYSMTSHSANIGWTGNGHETAWQMEYDTSGYLQGSGTVVTANFNPHNLTGLMSLTTYDAYVRSVCDAGDTSTWSHPVTFTTSCGAYTAPYFTDFDDVSSPDLPACWSFIEDLDNTNYEEVVTYTGLAFSQPNSVKLFNASGLNINGNLLLISPQFSDLNSTKQIRFYAYDFSNTSDLIIGTMTNPADPLTFTPFDTLTEVEMNDDVWEEHTITFTGYGGSDEYIALAHGLNTTDDLLFIDDFNYEDSPTCPAPRALTVNSVALTAANIGWKENGLATAWQIEYGTAGFTLGTGTVVNTNSNPDHLTGLMSATLYDFYVRSVCGAGDTSQWSGPGSFETECDIQNAPYAHGFPTFPSSCWFESGNTTVGGWESDEFLNNAANSNGVNVYIFSLNRDTLYGPNVDLSSGGPHRLKWDIGLTSWNSTAAGNFGSDDELQVWISSNGGPWEIVETYNTGNQPATLGQTDSVDLLPYVGTTVQLAFFATGGTVIDPEDYEVHIDNVEMYEYGPPTCGALNINGAIDSGTYQGLSIDSDALIESPNMVIFKAETEIDLLPDFEIELGAEFNAIIEDCP